MNFQWYPFDTQVCSHAFLVDENPDDVKIEYESVDVENSPILESFSPDWYISIKAGNAVTTSENLQILPLDLTFQRKIPIHILHLYLPSIMLCIASIASLFIPPDFIPGRMGLSVTSCLSMITLFVAAK